MFYFARTYSPVAVPKVIIALLGTILVAIAELLEKTIASSEGPLTIQFATIGKLLTFQVIPSTEVAQRLLFELKIKIPLLKQASDQVALVRYRLLQVTASVEIIRDCPLPQTTQVLLPNAMLLQVSAVLGTYDQESPSVEEHAGAPALEIK